MGRNDEKLKEDFVDFAVGLRRFLALPVKNSSVTFEFANLPNSLLNPVAIKRYEAFDI